MVTQIIINLSLFLIGVLGMLLNKQNVLRVIISIELMLLSIHLCFLISSVFLDDGLGQIMSLLILTVAAGEAAVGLAIIISFYKLRNNILIHNKFSMKN